MGRTESVILSAAKDLATGRMATVGLRADFSSAGQMLHFVQHDKGRAREDHDPGSSGLCVLSDGQPPRDMEAEPDKAQSIYEVTL